MTLSDLPAVNAALNTLSTIFLTCGYVFIRRQRQVAHRNCMIGAVISSALFLTCYLIYHYNAGRTEFRDPEWFRPIYLAILGTHTVLAAVIVPMVLMTLSRGLKRQDVRHRALARWTLPIWMYVSITGVVIYLMLYRL